MYNRGREEFQDRMWRRYLCFKKDEKFTWSRKEGALFRSALVYLEGPPVPCVAFFCHSVVLIVDGCLFIKCTRRAYEYFRVAAAPPSNKTVKRENELNWIFYLRRGTGWQSLKLNRVLRFATWWRVVTIMGVVVPLKQKFL